MADQMRLPGLDAAAGHPGRIVEPRCDSALQLGWSGNPWVIQLLGLLAEESRREPWPKCSTLPGDAR
jgi:hypothetical protein